MKKITALETFSGTVDELGHKAKVYEKGKDYTVHAAVANLFIAGKLAKAYVEPKPAEKTADVKPAAPAEAKPAPAKA